MNLSEKVEKLENELAGIRRWMHETNFAFDEVDLRASRAFTQLVDRKFKEQDELYESLIEAREVYKKAINCLESTKRLQKSYIEARKKVINSTSIELQNQRLMIDKLALIVASFEAKELYLDQISENLILGPRKKKESFNEKLKKKLKVDEQGKTETAND